LYGAFLVKRFKSIFSAFHLLPILWFGRAAGILPPRPWFLELARAGTVKVGRRASLYTHTALARPHLDGGEHGSILSAIGRLA
jgi:hypothetical protein